MSEVERYLFQYNQLEIIKKNLENDLLDAKELYQAQSENLMETSHFSLALSSKTNKKDDPVLKSIVRIVDVYRARMERIAFELETLDKRQQQIKKTVDQTDLNVYEKSYVLMRYFKGLRSATAARKLNYSESQTKRFRVSALAKIKKTMGEGR